MNLDTLDVGELYTEICELAREQGISTHEGWAELCDEVVDSHFDIGEMKDDQDVEGFRLELHDMWDQYKRESGVETLEALSEDPEMPHA